MAKKIDGDGDALSSLSDSVIHHILSFMDAKYAVRTSILSSRWRDLWKSLPHLTFNKTITPQNNHFVDLVNGVLIVRDGSDIQTFRLLCIDDADSPYLHNWILGAIGRNVHEINIEVGTTSKKLIKLPNGLFNCQTLTTLKLSLDEVTSFPYYILINMPVNLPDNLHVHWPIRIYLPNLKVLHLFRVSFRDFEAASKLILSCPSLLTLEMLHCSFDARGCFVINSPTLKFLKMQTWVGSSTTTPSCTIRVCAPNLKYLLCDDDMRKEFSFVNKLAYLEHAKIAMEVIKGRMKCSPLDDWPIDDDQRKRIVRRVTSILEAVRYAEYLTLNPMTLLVSFESRFAQQSLSLQFPNLKHLKLQTRFSRDSAISIMYLLKSSPQIETLKIEIVENTFSWEPLILEENQLTSTNIGEWWQSELSNQCMFHHLKDVKIFGVVGCVTEVKLVEVMLKKALILRRVVLCSCASSPIRKNWLIDLSQILLDVPRASSNVALVLI
ncbi:hypothetical protein Scep_010526 [Stephania cephalantha]|uniref:F-box domain-containing protein n=1 Tax=Stephania cephalantha TaxID=152367 RepID=A0AAP0PH54_9MAGN